ncbi:MAG: histidine ammonia-lyase [Deltaproteobacteria bacterium]|nr:histidine ammonia-lyase [Deltaproteobacteria bacterium]
MSEPILSLTGLTLSLATVRDFEQVRPRVVLADEARMRMDASVEVVRDAVRTERVSYGINTGFGVFANRHIAPDQVLQLQVNLVRSHACGIGTPLAPHLVRRILLLKANSLAVGCSGVRPEVVEALLALCNHDVLPVIPSHGSVGASGDLAPLAYVALALIGEGEAMQGSRLLTGANMLEAAGITPLTLEAKEGLALLNGTQVSLALALEGLFQAEQLLTAAIVVGALTVEGLAGSHSPFDARVQAVSRFPSQIEVAERLRLLLTESEIWRSHADCDRVQDPYSLRCMPQVYGAVASTISHARSVLEAACNGVSDNPLIFGTDIISGGNFHAEPLGFVSDFLAIAVAELASMAERRIDALDRRVNPRLSMFLAKEPGLESGFMIAHVSATALVSENKTLAHPASVDSLPTSAGQEDHVSMAPWAGMKLQRICDNTRHVLAIELLVAAHAIDSQRPLRTSPRLEEVHALVRARVPYRPYDHRLDRDIATLAALIAGGELDRFVV